MLRWALALLLSMRRIWLSVRLYWPWPPQTYTWPTWPFTKSTSPAAVAAGRAVGSPSKAAQVFEPQMPSASSPEYAWKLRAAPSVLGP